MRDTSDVQHIRSAKLNPIVCLKNLDVAEIDENIDVLGERLLERLLDNIMSLFGHTYLSISHHIVYLQWRKIGEAKTLKL